MRIISVDKLEPGMVLARSVIAVDKTVLLQRHVELTNRYIHRLKAFGFRRCYIEDGISEGIDPPHLLDDQVRCDTVASVATLYTEIEREKRYSVQTWSKIESLVRNILNEVLDNSELVFDLSDLKTFDDYTFTHCVSVAMLSIAMGVQMRLKKEELFNLAIGALMHDVGKMFVPVDILNKPGALTDKEYKVMQEHPILGYEYLTDTTMVPEKVCKAVLNHHERADGFGYPNGLKSEEIDLFAKIYAIADVYDALISDRSYRKAWPVNEAIEYVLANSGIRFDIEIVKVFMKNVVPYPIGTIVSLSNNSKAIVIQQNKQALNRPTVRVFQEEGKFINPYIISLGDDRNYLNVTILDSVDM